MPAAAMLACASRTNVAESREVVLHRIEVDDERRRRDGADGVARARQAYCFKIDVEYMHNQFPTEKSWSQQRI
mgnify:CR=1 FL=1